MAETAAKLGQPAIALTDHGVVHGAVDFYKFANLSGVKPIVGMEGYITEGSRLEKDRDQAIRHITLLAQNSNGYRNLLNLASKSHLEGFYRRPRMDKNLLEQFSEDIIVLSGCPSSELARAIQDQDLEKPKEIIGWYKEIFKDRYFLELMNHEGVKYQDEINKSLVDLSAKNEIPLVVTNDSHYVRQADAPLQDILTCIYTRTNVNDPKRLHMADNTYHIRSSEDMRDEWHELPKACDNTIFIAESCNLKLDLGKVLLPKFQTEKGKTSIQFLKELAEQGLKKRFPNPTKELFSRLNYELEIIEETKYADYFLVCWDIFSFVNKRGILSAVRGSAASSLVLYCLEVTHIDPVDASLFFERFLNLERREMPDIDMDFADDRREEVIRYCVDKYGQEHVAQIITFGTLGARAAIRDTTRALDQPLELGDRLARMIPSKLGITLAESLKESEELKSALVNDPDSRQIIETAKKIEGSVRHASTHAAGVVISEAPLTDHVALMRSTDSGKSSIPTTQYTMGSVEAVGLLKMDFLGLTNLSVLKACMKFVKQTTGEQINIYDIQINDKKTFDLLSSGDTFGVFQLESAGMRKYIRELKPSAIMDIAAMIALYRPGPMEHIETFINAKYHRAKIKYPHEDLRDLLEPTHGVIVYQDQVMLIAQEFGGYTLGEADILRKAMGKKIPEVMKAETKKFVDGALSKGYTKTQAEKVFELIEPFAGYGFNKAHAVSYAYIAYWTAFFKANYPVQFFCSLMNSNTNDPEKIGECVREAKAHKIKIQSPNINLSEAAFKVEKNNNEFDSIRFGLAAIKNVGSSAADKIVKNRIHDGPFESIDDFCIRVDSKYCNRRNLESLVRCGAFDIFGPRGGIFEATEKMVSTIQGETRLRDSGQTSLFDMFGEFVAPEKIEILNTSELSQHEMVVWERELLGIELTTNPLTEELHNQPDHIIVFASQMTEDLVGQKRSLLGQIFEVRDLKTRRGELFKSMRLALLDGNVEIVVWPNLLDKTINVWEQGNFVSVIGTVRERNGIVSLSVTDASIYQFNTEGGKIIDIEPRINDTKSQVTNAKNYTNIPTGPIINDSVARQIKPKPTVSDIAKEPETLLIQILESGNPTEDKFKIEDVFRLLLENPGQDEVTLHIMSSTNKLVKMVCPTTIKINAKLEERLGEVLGEENISVAK
jgi:DNA polymerase-3 subunit alpha